MKKILFILLLVMPSMLIFADGPQYKFLRGNGNVSSFDQVYDVNINTKTNKTAGTRVANYENVNTVANPTGRSLVSSDLSIGSERNHGSVSGTSGSSSTGGVVTDDYTVTATTGLAIGNSLKNGKSSGRQVVLGQFGHQALFGEEMLGIFENGGTTGGNTNAEGATPKKTPLGDALLPLLMMILSFSAILYFRKK